MNEQPRVRTVRRIPAKRHTRKPYVAAYIRVSSKKGHQDESYEAQAAYYENLIRSNPEWDFVGVYGDKQSGTHCFPGFGELSCLAWETADLRLHINPEKRESLSTPVAITVQDKKSGGKRIDFRWKEIV